MIVWLNLTLGVEANDEIEAQQKLSTWLEKGEPTDILLTLVSAFRSSSGCAATLQDYIRAVGLSYGGPMYLKGASLKAEQKEGSLDVSCLFSQEGTP